MKICVIGTGYVGLVTGACLADFGNSVICMDKDKMRIKGLLKGAIPFYEPGLPEIISRNMRAKRLFFATDLGKAVKNAEIVFITVGTPPKSDGEADISAVVEVAKSIARTIKTGKTKTEKGGFKIIVNKSTVPVGMGDYVTKVLIANGVSRNSFSVVSNPEFLREGSAIKDFFNPDRIVIGASNNRAFNIITELYRPLNAHIVFTDIKSAELIKYASNAFLATKISFINEIARICEKCNADVTLIADAMGIDKRIGRAFLNAGLGYGGSCFPKDIAALLNLAVKSGYEPKILAAVNQVNDSQVNCFGEKMVEKMGDLKGKKIAVLGISFKPETDDLREAPALKLLRFIIKRGGRISAYDPVAEKKGKMLLPEVNFCPGPYDAMKDADAIVLATEWAEFREIDFEKARKLVKNTFLFDGRNVFDPKRLMEAGFKYFGVGR